MSEVALTVMLLAASGLLIRTLIHLETLPPGFNPICATCWRRPWVEVALLSAMAALALLLSAVGIFALVFRFNKT